jgi:putative membrane protein
MAADSQKRLEEYGMQSDAGGSDIAGDPRVYFAAERTLLAWVRTGLAMMGFGFVVARFGLFLRELAAMQAAAPPRQHGFSLWVGTALVIRRLEKGQPLQFRPLSLSTITALLMAVLGVLMAGYLVFGVSPPK